MEQRKRRMSRTAIALLGLALLVGLCAAVLPAWLIATHTVKLDVTVHVLDVTTSSPVAGALVWHEPTGLRRTSRDGTPPTVDPEHAVPSFQREPPVFLLEVGMTDRTGRSTTRIQRSYSVPESLWDRLTGSDPELDLDRVLSGISITKDGYDEEFASSSRAEQSWSGPEGETRVLRVSFPAVHVRRAADN